MPSNVIDGTTLHWELIGHGGDPIVLVHDSWADHHSADRMLPELAQSFRVLAYDRRGHSQSEPPGGQ